MSRRQEEATHVSYTPFLRLHATAANRYRFKYNEKQTATYDAVWPTTYSRHFYGVQRRSIGLDRFQKYHSCSAQ